MKINYSKTFGITLAISLMALFLYGGYSFDKKMKERIKTVSSLKDKTFLINSISDLSGKTLDSSFYNHGKMVIHLSVKCPHCLDVVKALDRDKNHSLKDKVFPVFKVSNYAIDSFAKQHDLQNVKLFHVENIGITQLIKSVPTFLVLDERNKVKKVYSGIPRIENKDSLLTYLTSLLEKNSVVQSSLPVESCH